jgi:release factor glutamine methyltransferase
VTLRELATLVRQRFEHAGLPDADIEAEALVRMAAGVDRAAYFAGAPSSPAIEQAVDRLVGRRLEREPLAYIAGRREFFGLSFGVNAAVLIPRPETELLVELALAHLEDEPDAITFDVGTGSGCIAICVEKHREVKGRTCAVDPSAPALAVARVNAREHGADVAFMRGDLLSAVRSAELVLANLPYIPTGEVDALEPELRDWEPRLALDGGESGTDLIESLIRDCAQRVRPRRALFEVAVGQAGRVASTARAFGFTVETHRDLSGIERVVDLRLQG